MVLNIFSGSCSSRTHVRSLPLQLITTRLVRDPWPVKLWSNSSYPRVDHECPARLRPSSFSPPILTGISAYTLLAKLHAGSGEISHDQVWTTNRCHATTPDSKRKKSNPIPQAARIITNSDVMPVPTDIRPTKHVAVYIGDG